MSDVKETIFKIIEKPKVYFYYIGDVSILTNTVEEIYKLKEIFEKFTV